MALIDELVTPSTPAAVWIWSAPKPGAVSGNKNELLSLQFWPESLQDDYQVEYAEHTIPGGSHPLYQWTGGRGRTISFQTVFVSEINTTHESFGDLSVPSLTPSLNYTVNVAAAISRIQSWLRPYYNGNGSRLGTTDPPPILRMSFPGTWLNGINGSVLSVICRNAPVTYEAWFPNGEPRVATVDLTFSEIVQEPGAQRATVKFIDAKRFKDLAIKYKPSGNGSNLNPFIGGL